MHSWFQHTPKAARKNALHPAVRPALRLLLWLTVLMAAPAHAQAPACIDLWLPAKLPQRETWKKLMLQETKPLLSADGGVCAQLDVWEEHGETDTLSLKVAWLGNTRVASLSLEEVPVLDRPRVGSLWARGLLQQLMQESLAPSYVRQTGTTPATDPKLPAPESGDSVQSKTRPEAPAVAPEKATDARIDDEVAPRKSRPSTWSGSALTGSSLALSGFNALLHFELGLQRSFVPQHLRIGLAVLAKVALAPMNSENFKLGGPGARVGIDLLATNTPRRRIWLGLGANVLEFILRRQAVDPSTIPVGQAVPLVDTYHTAFSMDLRSSIEFALSRSSYIVIALELAYALRFLNVRDDTSPTDGFRGVLAGLHAGAVF